MIHAISNTLVFTRLQFFILIMSLFLSACSSTKIIEEWSGPEYKGPALKKILIIGAIKNKSRRHAFEDDFAKLITNGERKGIASYTLLPDLKDADHKEHILKAIKQTGAEAVLIVTTHGLYQQERTTAPSFDYVPGASMGYSYGMYGYYNASHSYIFNPGSTVSDTILRVDTKLFDTASEKMIWSAKTKTVNPESAAQVISEYEHLVISDMKRHGLIK